VLGCARSTVQRGVTDALAPLVYAGHLSVRLCQLVRSAVIWSMEQRRRCCPFKVAPLAGCVDVQNKQGAGASWLIWPDHDPDPDLF